MSPLEPKLILHTKNKKITLKVRARDFTDFNEVFNAKDDDIFKEIIIESLS